ncbi:hypothetical protein ABZX75_07750 [Streptomyces sp. NPDC003038]|uniref:hypothetical protein n=1 Tax=unclassified Streptomyces TaxID=2593676 RepID=UPI0033A71710
MFRTCLTAARTALVITAAAVVPVFFAQGAATTVTASAAPATATAVTAPTPTHTDSMGWD